MIYRLSHDFVEIKVYILALFDIKCMKSINDEINMALRGFVANVGSDVIGTMLVYRNGFIVSSISRNGINTKSFGALLAAVKGSIEKALSKVDAGSVNSLILRTNKYIITILPVNQNAFLISISPETSNLGLILMGLEEAREKISKLLQ